MTDNDRVILARLLRLAARKFSTHICNYLELPNTEENWLLWKSVMNAVDPTNEIRQPPPGRSIWAIDWIMMDELARRLAPEVGQNGETP